MALDNLTDYETNYDFVRQVHDFADLFGMRFAVDLNEPPHPNHDQFAELDAHNYNSERIVASKMSIPEGRARNRRAKSE